jgi:iron complex transport system substrate-binding protein
MWLFLLSACSEQQKLTPIENKDNICRYSKWLRIAEFPEYTQIDILSPSTNELLQTIKIGDGGINPGAALATFSSTHIGMLAELNSLNRIVAVQDVKYVHNEIIRNAFDAGSITSFGNEGSPNAEKIVKSGAKVIIHSAYSGPFPNEKKLKEIGITCISNFDWSETHPLGKAEWLLLFGYLTGKKDLAKEKFKAIETAYLETSKKSTKGNEHIISGNVFGDFWDTPAGESYHAKLIADAGGSYVYAQTKGIGSLSLALEKVVKDSENTTFWLNPGFSTKESLIRTNPKAKFINAFTTGKIYCYSHDANKFWEMNAVQPHLILEDYRRIFTQKDLENLYFYKEVK